MKNLDLAVISKTQKGLMVSSDDSFSKITELLGRVNWELRVGIVQHNSGLPLGRILVERDMAVGLGSLASELGHKTLGEFITTPQTDKGLGIDWNQWEELVTAKLLKDHFLVPESNPDEILNSVARVSDELGRQPISSEEYHNVRQGMLQQDLEHQLKAAERQHQELIVQNKGITDKLEENQRRMRLIEAKYQTATEELENAYNSKQEQINHIKNTLANSAENELRTTVAKLNGEHRLEIEEINARHDKSLKEARGRLEDQLLEAYVHVDEVKERLSRIQAELNEENSRLLAEQLELKAQLAAKNERLQDSSSKIQLLERDVFVKDEAISRLEKDKESLKSAKSELDAEFRAFKEQHEGIMRGDVEGLKHEVSDLKNKLKHESETSQGLMADASEKDYLINSLKSQLEQEGAKNGESSIRISELEEMISSLEEANQALALSAPEDNASGESEASAQLRQTLAKARKRLKLQEAHIEKLKSDKSNSNEDPALLTREKKKSRLAIYSAVLLLFANIGLALFALAP